MDIGSVKSVSNLDSNYMAGNKLNIAQTAKDLGVLLDRGLTFSPHIAEIVARARQRLFLLFKVFNTRNYKYLTRGFKTYILPILEYNSTVWSPHLVGDITLLESVQRRFTKRLPGLENLTYGDRLQILGLITLEKRRLHADLAFCFKVVRGFIPCNIFDYGLVRSHNVSTRGHIFKLQIQPSFTNSHKYAFGRRIVPVWNSLDDNTVAAPSVGAFKRLLFKVDFNKFLYFKTMVTSSD